MKDEAAFKKHFKASVRAQGGFSISLAAPTFPGVPDLYVIMPGFAPVLLEAKWLKECTAKFNRKPGFTPLQENFINNCNKVHDGVAWGLIGGIYSNKIFAALTRTGRNFTYESLGMLGSCTINKQSEHFDVKQMFELYVPKLNYTFDPLLTKDWKPDTLEVTSQLSGDTVDTSTLAV